MDWGECCERIANPDERKCTCLAGRRSELPEIRFLRGMQHYHDNVLIPYGRAVKEKKDGGRKEGKERWAGRSAQSVPQAARPPIRGLSAFLSLFLSLSLSSFTLCG